MQQIERGVLWIYSNEIKQRPKEIAPGSWAHFTCQGRVAASGYFNAHSLISGRVLTRALAQDRRELIRERLEQAFTRRRSLIGSGSIRLVFSEADFFPGLVIDCYSDQLVIQSNTAGVDQALAEIVESVEPIFEKIFSRALQAIVIKADSSIRALEGVKIFTQVVKGQEARLRDSKFAENGVQFAADFIDGQKTGFFLDQRENRLFLRGLVEKKEGARVLDLCSYSGGWGLSALAGGAQHVTFVDQSAEALALVDKGLALNDFSKTRVTLVQSDVFDFLERDPGAHDFVIADPPAFVKSKKVLPQAMKAYEKLNRLSWRRTKESGVLLTCSCSYHLSEADFQALLQTAVAKENGEAHLIFRGGQGSDHPVLLSMPETRYLKCLGLRKLG